MSEQNVKLRMPFAWPAPKFEIGQIVRYAAPRSDGDGFGLRMRIDARLVKEFPNGSTVVSYDTSWISDDGLIHEMSAEEELLEDVE